MTQKMPATVEIHAFAQGASHGKFWLVAVGENSHSGFTTRLEEQNTTVPPAWARLYNDDPGGVTSPVMSPFCCELEMTLDGAQSSVTEVLPDATTRAITIMRSGKRCKDLTEQA